MGRGVLRYLPLINCIHLKNSCMNSKAIFFRCKIKCTNGSNKITIGEGTYLKKSTILIMGKNNEVRIGKNVRANGLLIWIEDDGNFVDIQDNVIFVNNDRIACMEGTKVYLGNDCLLSSDIVIRTGDSHSIVNSENERINMSLSIHIGDHVWIGQRAIILKGTKIERDSVIAAGSIVTRKTFVPNVVLAGNPANIVKRNINWK